MSDTTPQPMTIDERAFLCTLIEQVTRECPADTESRAHVLCCLVDDWMNLKKTWERGKDIVIAVAAKEVERYLADMDIIRASGEDAPHV